MSDVIIENPYAEHDDDEDVSRMSTSTAYGPSDFSMSRNVSSTSLNHRSRSGTTGSGPSIGHISAGRLRMPIGEFGGLPQLNTKVHTQSPGAFAGAFSSTVGFSFGSIKLAISFFRLQWTKYDARECESRRKL
jgi:hypothetical protein